MESKARDENDIILNNSTLNKEFEKKRLRYIRFCLMKLNSSLPVSQSHCARMIQDDTNSSDSITSQSSTALVTLLVEVWDIYLEYLTTHTSMHSTNEFRKV